MKTSKLNYCKRILINILGIASLVLFSNTSVMSKENSPIANGDLGSGRIKSETVKSSKKPSSISGTDIGSGRIKAKKAKTK